MNSVLHGLRQSRFAWYWVPTIVYCLLIFVLSSLSKGIYIPSLFGVDKVVHFIEYGILGFLLARSILGFQSSLSSKLLVSLAVVLAIIYGISDEVHQAFVPGRNASPWDVLADGLGGLMGALLYMGTGGRSERKGLGSKE